MAKIINVEKSQFIEDTIQIFTSNKLGQYSKFLEKNPIFVTYFPVNEAATTVDLGTGNIDNELGINSPIRYNRIGFLPAYNIPELKPELEIEDDRGPDINLELTDITFVPGTVQPKPYDLLLIEIPGAKQMLFRVNNFKLNTIQSNDYYMADMHLVRYGDNVENELSGQIIDRYQTVFENIGTQDKCFIREDDIDKINALVRTMEILKESYVNKFYDATSNSFLLSPNVSHFKYEAVREKDITFIEKDETETFSLPQSTTDKQLYIDTVCYIHDAKLYDPYLEKFITDTGILEDPEMNYSFILTPNDMVPPDFNMLYNKTLFKAIQEHHTKIMGRYMYFYQSPVQKLSSPYAIYRMSVNSVKLLDSSYDRFMEPDKKLEKFINDSIMSFEAKANFFNENKDKYVEEDYMNAILILSNAQLDIYACKFIGEAEIFVKDINTKISGIRTIDATSEIKYKDDMLNYLRSLDEYSYSIENISKMQEILNHHIKIIESAPPHVYESVYERFVNAISEVPVLSEDDILERHRDAFLKELRAIYTDITVEQGLPTERIELIYDEAVAILYSDATNTIDIMDSIVESFNTSCMEELEKYKYELENPEVDNGENPDDIEPDNNDSSETVNPEPDTGNDNENTGDITDGSDSSEENVTTPEENPDGVNTGESENDNSEGSSEIETPTDTPDTTLPEETTDTTTENTETDTPVDTPAVNDTPDAPEDAEDNTSTGEESIEGGEGNVGDSSTDTTESM